MTLASDLTSVTVTLDLAKANLNALATEVNSEIAARDAQIANLQALLAAGGGATPPPPVTLTLASSLTTISGTTYARITCSWNVDAVSIGRNGNDAFNSGVYSTPVVAGQRTATFDYCLSNTLYTITLTLAAPAVPVTNSTTTPTYAPPVATGTITFTGADGAALPSPYTAMSDAGVPSSLTPNNKAWIQNNAMALYCKHVSGDQYTRGSYPLSYSNIRRSGRVWASDLGIFSASTLMRHTGNYEAGTSSTYIFEIRWKDGTVGFGRKNGTPVYTGLIQVPFVFVDGTHYYYRYEVQDNVLRLYLGTTQFSGSWTVTFTDRAGIIYGNGTAVEDWNGDHNGSTAGDHTVYFDDTLYEDLGGTYTDPGGGGGTGGVPVTGAHLLGVYMGNSPGDASYFGSLVNHEVKVLHAYCDIQYGLPSMFTSGGVTAWLQQDSTRRLLLGCNALTDEPGNFESGTVVARMQQLATAIKNQGIASQVIIRFCYEMSGDWMPWGRQYAGNNDGTRYKAMWRNNHAAVNAIFPFEWDWCPIFWDTGDTYTDGMMNSDWFYPGDDVVNYVGSDNYDVHISSQDFPTRWNQCRGRMQNQVTFAARHGKVPVQDEWACWNTNSKEGGGDDDYYIAHHLQFQKDNGYGWGAYFNSTAGDVNMVLTDAPNSVAAFRAHVWA